MKGPGTFSYRSGTSFARGLTIDPLLSEEDARTLYEKWENGWGEPLEFQGGAKAITCDMVVNVPARELVRVYGKSLAERLLTAAADFKEV